MLHIACQEGLIDTVLHVLEQKPELTETTSKAGWTPLMNACEAGHLEAARILIDFEPDLLLYVCQNGSPLHAAISGRQPYETVKLLISRDVLVNKPDLSNVSPLYLAVFTGHPEVVQALLDAGARPSIDNYAQEPLLHVCAERGFVEIA